MALKVGDKISFLDEVGEGKVVAILDELRVTVLVDGFERTYNNTELIRIDPAEREDFYKRVTGETFSGSIDDMEEVPLRKKNVPKRKTRLPNEINLHMEDMQVEYSTLSTGEKLQLQLRYFNEKLEEAIRLKKKSLIVIHGVGKGTLRAEVRLILDDYPNITYCDASYDTYGYGATEVIIQ
jgi:dsDNA-specific endonuclease/ATPase MutS2